MYEIENLYFKFDKVSGNYFAFEANVFVIIGSTPIAIGAGEGANQSHTEKCGFFVLKMFIV